MSGLAAEIAADGSPRPAVAVVALGANLGARESTIEAALRDMAALPLTALVRASSAVETVAITTAGEDPDAPRYLNAVALVATRLAPSLLLERLHSIEAEHGRERRERWGDRTLDLDLIAYGAVQSSDERLLLPHPRAAERSFVLAPWLEIEPRAVLPGHGPVSELVDRLRATT